VINLANLLSLGIIGFAMVQVNMRNEVNFKGSGQECPLYTA